MKIYDSHGAQVGELERPGAVYDDIYKTWFEPSEFRIPRPGDYYLDGKVYRAIAEPQEYSAPRWVMRPIPRPTPEQLAAIGMRERDDRPVECKEGDTIWGVNGMEMKKETYQGQKNIGKHRWVLVKAEKEPVNMDVCPMCHSVCGHINWDYTPAPAPAPVFTGSLKEKSDREQADAWEQVFALCKSLGMKHNTPSGLEDVRAFIKERKAQAPAPTQKQAAEQLVNLSAHELCVELGMKPSVSDHVCEDLKSFIRSLAQRAGEQGYTVEEINHWLETLGMTEHEGVRDLLNDPQDGIEAVTGRKK